MTFPFTDFEGSERGRRRRADHAGSDAAGSDHDDPAQHALLADSIGLALLVVLDTLSPAERLAFVLHDIFVVPFEQVGAILDR